jgi:hypothetical protein
MGKVLCHINDVGFSKKPTELSFYGKLREKMIQKPWDYVDTNDFIQRVTWRGTAFYGAIFDGHDLMNVDGQTQRSVWRAQSIIGVDFDHCPVHPQAMAKHYLDLGYMPWLAYKTFSSGKDGLYSFRLLWRVEVDHNVSYEQWKSVIDYLANLTEWGDPRARDCTRMWQGGNHGPSWVVPTAPIPYEQFRARIALDKALFTES